MEKWMNQKYLKMTGIYDNLQQMKRKYGRQGYEFIKSQILREKENCYSRWIEENENEEMECSQPEHGLLISAIFPVFHMESSGFRGCVESVKSQSYQNWELIIITISTADSEKIKEEYKTENRIQVICRGKDEGISKVVHDSLMLARGEYITFLDTEDILASSAFCEMAGFLNENPESDFVYSDEDQITETGDKRFSPFFKPDWSPDLFMDLPYTGHLAFYRRSLAKKLGGFRDGFPGAEEYEFVLRLTEVCEVNRIGHVPKVLCHRREQKKRLFFARWFQGSVSEGFRKAKEEALFRRGLQGKVSFIPDMRQYGVEYQAEGEPLVSVIIPSKDNVRVLKRCISSVRKLTVYKNYEVIVVDNGSSEENRAFVSEICQDYNCKYLYKKQSFNFSGMCNQGAAAASGEYFLFLNDDTEVRSKDWMTLLLGQAALTHAGAVGAKLLYPDSHKIQHTGVIGLETGPCHGLQKADDRAVHYFGINRVTCNYSAVTGACLIVSSQKFYEAGGFDEAIPVAYNDIDLCLRLYEKGYYNAVRNDVILYHYESLSRGIDDADRLRKERELLYQKHPWYREKDPFYNLNLIRTSADFGIQARRKNAFGKVEKFQAQNLKTGDSLNFYIDQFEIGSVIHIHGWAYEKDGEHALDTEVSVAFLGNRGDSYEVKTQKIFREDMAFVFPDSRGIPFSGFCCDIKASLFHTEGEYRIALLLKRKGREDRIIVIFDDILSLSSSAFLEKKKAGSLQKRENLSRSAGEKMKTNVEQVDVREWVSISGWAFVADCLDNALWERNLLLKEKTGTIWELETTWKARPDVAAHYGMENSLMNSGFVGTIQKDALKECGTCFRIGILLRHSKTGEEIFCWTSENLELT